MDIRGSIRSSVISRKFNTLIEIQDKNIYISYIGLVVCVFLYLFVGMCYYATEYHDDNDGYEGGEPPNTWFKAFYFVVTTMTTLGYGNTTPTSTISSSTSSSTSTSSTTTTTD